MSLLIPPQVSTANVDWDVEAEMQKELDAISINSYMSSSSSSTEAEETFPAEDPDRTSEPMQKLLEDWRIKEKKLQSFEIMLSGTKTWKYDMVDDISDQGHNSWPGVFDDLPDYNEVRELVDPMFQCGKTALNNRRPSQINNKVFGETWKTTEPERPVQEHDSTPTVLIPNSTSSDFEEANVKNTKSYQEEDDFPCSMDYEDALSMLRKTRMRMLEEYRAEEAERFVGKNLKRLTETEESRKIFLLACRRRQELENEIWKEKQDKIALLDLEQAKTIQLLEELQKTEERDLQTQKMDIECSERSSMDWIYTHELDEELELRRLEQEKALDMTARQDKKHEQAVQTATNDHRVKCCVLIQSWIRGFFCRRNYQDLKHRNAHALGSLLLPCESASIQEIRGQEYPKRELQEDKAVQTATNDHRVKCCVLIQSWIRGFICRRNYQDLKHRNAHALVSLLLPCESASIQEIRGQEYPKCELQEDNGKLGVSEEPAEFSHGQEYQQCGAQAEYGLITTSQERIYGKSQSPDEILTTLADLAESGSMRDFKYYLDLATSNGLFAEAGEMEAQLIQRKENVQSWLEQVVQGWDTTRSKIEEKIQEARRLELYPILTVAEAVMSAREKEIYDKLEASILNASRSNYIHWMRKAKSFGSQDNLETLDTISKSFQRTIKMVRNFLKREAKLGTKDKYVVLFKNALSLGLQSEVNLAVKILLKRVLQVFKRAILLECTATTDVDSSEQDWNRVFKEAAEIGLDSQTIAELRQTISTGKSFESVERTWVTTFQTKDIGGSFTIVHDNLVGVADNAPDKQLPANSRKFSILSGCSLSALSGGVVMPKSNIFWPVLQDWSEMNRLQRDWQQHTLHLRTPGNDNYSQRVQYSRWERDCLPTKCAREKITESAKNPTLANTAKETVDLDRRPVGRLNLDNDCREEEEGSSEFSESEEDLRGVSQGQISEMPEKRRVTPRKSTLAREMLEEKLRCNREELRWVVKLDLTDEHLKSLGRRQIFRWCPSLRFLTVDMNKLTSLRGVFQSDENCLEQLSVKDNLLPDVVGLECLHKLNVLHLDGNLLSLLGFALNNHTVPNEKRKPERHANVSVPSKKRCNLPSPLGHPVVEYCWPRLKVLTVGCNRLTKILNLGNLCPNLEVLDVGSNQIFSLGTEDNCLAGLRHLRVLDVGQNRLQGKSLWKGLENCPELVSLVASRNKLRELPNHFGSVLLREIWLNGNAIRQLSCKAWLPSLQRLYLQDNMIDTLDSMWGCPALEVLDLSFNSISEVSHLRHLSCFPCLRSLQLNDNPVSEQEDHATYVLQAVPWLAELDNEAVGKASRDKAVTKIFKRTMDVVGLEFLKEKLSRGEVLLPGFSNPSGLKETCSLNNIVISESNECQFLPRKEVNNLLNGEADEFSLWEILSEAKRLASSSSIMQNLLAVNEDMVKFEGLRSFSESELEARSSMVSYQQMTFGLKGRLQAATKETCIARLLKDRDQSVQYDSHKDHIVENPCRFLNLSSESHSSGEKAGESNLESCLEEHTTFDSAKYREVYSENKEYKLQTQNQTRRVTRVQAVLRGYLARIRVRLLREQKSAMCQEKEQNCACKIQAAWRGWKARRAKLLEFLQRAQFRGAVVIQAHWRGYSIRQRFRRAVDTAKYMDDDDFEYVLIDESEFLAGEIALSAVCQPSLNMLSFLGNSSTSASKASITPVDKRNEAFPVVEDEGSNPEYETHDLHEVNPLAGLVELDAEGTTGTAPPTNKVESDASHVMEIIPGTFPTGALSHEDTDGQLAPKDEARATQRTLHEKPAGLELLEESERKDENRENEETRITDLLERIGIKSKVNMPSGDSDVSEEDVSRIINGHLVGISQSSEDRKEDLGFSEEEASTIVKRHLGGISQSSEDPKRDYGSSEEEASRIIEGHLGGISLSSERHEKGFGSSQEEVSKIMKGHLGGISQSSEDPKSRIIPDPSSLPAAEVKKREKVEELAKDWGFKNASTAQALLKARQRSQQQAKDAAHKNFLQDPEKRLKRFREKVQGQAPTVGAPTRHLEKRASHSISGLTLQMSTDEQELWKIPETDFHRKESSVHKQHGGSCPLPVPRLPHQRMEKRYCTESFQIKKDMTKPQRKISTRDPSAIHLPTVLLNTSLQVTPFNNL